MLLWPEQKERLFITVNTAESEVGKAQEYAADIYMNQGITESACILCKIYGRLAFDDIAVP